MLRLAADENLKGKIIRGLLRRNPALDLVRVQDVGLRSASDEIVLAWAAQEGRILLTHDFQTLLALAYDRVVAGQPMPGVFAIPSESALGPVIEDILILAEISEPHEWEGQVAYLPW